MRYNSKKGWYKILNPGKFIKPLDEYMQSTKMKDNDCYIQYKSSLERIAFCYADLNPRVVRIGGERINGQSPDLGLIIEFRDGKPIIKGVTNKSKEDSDENNSE